MKKPFILLLPLLLCGCETYEPYFYATVRPPTPPQPAPQQPWVNGKTTTYWVGRTGGPDGNTLHEAHPIYRREVPSQPQLYVSPEAFYPTNLPLPSTNAAFEQFEVLRAEAARSRELTLQLTRASEALAQQASGMRTAAENTRKLQDQMRQLLLHSTALSNRLQQLERNMTPGSSNLAPRTTNR